MLVWELIHVCSGMYFELFQELVDNREKHIHTWKEFKTAFSAVFLAMNFIYEMEEQLRNRVQNPHKSIQDSAYDYRALCLKWKLDMDKVALVQRILNNANPKVVLGLQGTVHRVAELVRVRGMIENDLAALKYYWSKVNYNKVPKAAPKNKKAELMIVKAENHSYNNPQTSLSFLAIPLTIRGLQGLILLDTGSTVLCGTIYGVR